MTENSWLNPRLKAKVRKTFEPRYKRKLTDEEAGNLEKDYNKYINQNEN